MEHRLSATLELRDRFTAKIKAAGSALGGFTRENKKTGSAIKDTSESIKAGVTSLRNMAVAVGAFKVASATFGFVKSSYLGYAELDQVLTKNKAIMGASAEETAKLKAQVLELGKTMPFTAKEVAEAQKYQAMAGYKTNEVLAMTPKLLKLSIASGEDLARTSDIMTDNLDAFGMKLSEADRLMDVMAATANNTNTSISMLGEAYTYVGAASRQFDSFEEVNILLGILANNGIKGAKAGRNLGAMYARLSKITPDMRKELEKTGTKLYDQQGKFKGLRKIIEDSKPALDRMTESQRNQWIATIAGTEGFKIWASVAGYSAEGTKKVTKAINESKGAVQEIYNITKDTPANKIKSLESAWEALKLQIAEGASPAITGMVEDLTSKIIDLADSGTFDKENVDAFFQAIRDGGNDSIVVLEGILAVLRPIGWAFKGIAAGTRAVEDLGTALISPLSTADYKEDTAIYKEFQKVNKMKSDSEESEAKRKERWIAAQKRKDALDNKIYMSRKQSGGMQNLVEERGIEGIVSRTDSEYEEMYSYLGRGNKNLKRERKIPGQNVIDKKENPFTIPSQKDTTLQEIQNSNKKKYVDITLNVNLSGAVMKESLSNKEIGDEIAKNLYTQMILQQ